MSDGDVSDRFEVEGILHSATLTQGTRRAWVKEDGCIEWHDAYDGRIHVCDLDEEIARLQSLREAVKETFGE